MSIHVRVHVLRFKRMLDPPGDGHEVYFPGPAKFQLSSRSRSDQPFQHRRVPLKKQLPYPHIAQPYSVAKGSSPYVGTLFDHHLPKQNPSCWNLHQSCWPSRRCAPWWPHCAQIH